MKAFVPPARGLGGAHLAKVVSVQDKDGLGRVKVTLLSPDPDGRAELWARVAVPFAGANYGAFFIPDVGEEVVVAFVGDNADTPIVIGSLWNGATSLPEGVGGDRVDRWTLTGKNGARIAIVESKKGGETIEIETPTGAMATLSEAEGGKISLAAAGNRVTIDQSGVTIVASKISMRASSFELVSGSVNVQSAQATFSGAVDCLKVTTTTIVSGTYTPGLGDIL